jgi:hypothetical protein
MHTAIRLFNPEGIRRFRSALQALKDGGAAEVPALLTTDATLTQVIAPQVQADNSLRFATSLELARYLHERIVQLPLADRFYHVGLWAWLSAFYLDAVAPAEQGRRKIGEIVRYIPPDDRSFRRVDRHLLASAVRLYAQYPEESKLFLYTPPHQRSDLLREITDSPEMAMSRGVIEALGILYWDAGRGRPKVGIKSSDELAPGTSRRFVALLNQFSRTYDLQGMTGEQIVRLLPEREFSRWFTPPPP